MLVRALHQLTAEMAEARAEARQYAAVSERSLSTGGSAALREEVQPTAAQLCGTDQTRVGIAALAAIAARARWTEEKHKSRSRMRQCSSAPKPAHCGSAAACC